MRPSPPHMRGWQPYIVANSDCGHCMSNSVRDFLFDFCTSSATFRFLHCHSIGLNGALASREPPPIGRSLHSDRYPFSNGKFLLWIPG